MPQGPSRGGREQGNPDRGRDHQTFREADLIGHPFSASGLVLGATGLVCPPRTIPLMPYFVSTLSMPWSGARSYRSNRSTPLR